MKNINTEIKRTGTSNLFLEGRVLYLKSEHRKTTISKNQEKLIQCLLNGVFEKEEIINFIWGLKNKKNNYNQLIHQFRKQLSSKGFPDDLIITIPRYGLCLNKYWLSKKSSRVEIRLFCSGDNNAFI
ncbi:winged helix-turn-helix domain-containing protein [Serratia rubidaea]|uniref:winged helix-turn-helix domain-containing protein n=1 Tax=Serratia rubidaea TaxID=61652 RepID=UPI00130EB5FF|nr:hypothetical protein [Serratia rubidaea]